MTTARGTGIVGEGSHDIHVRFESVTASYSRQSWDGKSTKTADSVLVRRLTSIPERGHPTRSINWDIQGFIETGVGDHSLGALKVVEIATAFR
jgi:hypothetical protein